MLLHNLSKRPVCRAKLKIASYLLLLRLVCHMQPAIRPDKAQVLNCRGMEVLQTTSARNTQRALERLGSRQVDCPLPVKGTSISAQTSD
jgi:hypothetical protein